MTLLEIVRNLLDAILHPHRRTIHRGAQYVIMFWPAMHVDESGEMVGDVCEIVCNHNQVSETMLDLREDRR